jgi:hypothetical protein
MRRPGLTVGRLMVVIVFVAISLAAFRWHFSLGSFVAGVSSLALGRTFTAIDRGRAEGWTITRGRGASILLGSFAVAATLLVGSLSAWLLATFIVTNASCSVYTHYNPYNDEPFVWLPGLIVASLVCSRLRQRIWPYRWVARRADSSVPLPGRPAAR